VTQEIEARTDRLAQCGGVRLPFQLPFCPDNLFGHLAATAVPGCEEVRDGAYRRSLRVPHGYAIVALSPEADHISCDIDVSDPRDMDAVVAACRWLLDLDADPAAIDRVLSADKVLRPLLAGAPSGGGCPDRWTDSRWRSAPFSDSRSPPPPPAPTPPGWWHHGGHRSTTSTVA
jgi:hypothetical protein